MRRLAPLLPLLIVTQSACRHEARAPRVPVSAAAESNAPSPEIADSALAPRFERAPAVAQFAGEASYYSDHLAGHRTASGERYRPAALTAAHRDLPLGTILRVTLRDGTKSVYVRVNDRGPYGSRRRVLDLSRAAFEQLGSLRRGVLEVRAEVVAYGRKRH